MKKSILLFPLFSFLFSLSGAFAYTSSDVSNATYLADQGIITKQTNIDNYRLDDTITRAEAVGIALKMKGVTLPDNYVCRNYFTDVRYDANNNWKCRAIEIAADQGIISRSNKAFRPSDTITRAESLSILVKNTGIKITPYVEEFISGKTNNLNPLFESGRYEEFTINDYEPWQTNLLLSVPCKIYTNFTCASNYPSNQINSGIDFYANTKALRKEVVNYATNIFIQIKEKQLGAGYFQQINHITFEIPKGWFVEENWHLLSVGPNYLNLSFDTGNKYSLYNLSFSVMDTDFRNNNFTPTLYTAPHDNIDSVKKQIKIEGILQNALEYKVVIDDAAGQVILMKWYVFLHDGKLLTITGWLRIRDEEDYSKLIPDIEKMIYSMKQ